MSHPGDSVQRREFLKILGPGLYVLFAVDDFVFGQQGGGPEATRTISMPTFIFRRMEALPVFPEKWSWDKGLIHP